MRLPFFSKTFVKRLHETAAANLSKYDYNTSSWLEEVANGQRYSHESALVVSPPPRLVIRQERNTELDSENSKLVFSWLSQLSPALAMEERLWAYLTHITFSEYMAARWPADSVSAIERRYLFEGSSFAALSRNGIARLWWAGYLTRDEKRDDPFELTNVLFMRQDIQVALFERSLGKSKSIRTSVLEFLAENHSWLAEESFGDRIKYLVRELNLLGGVAVLDALPKKSIHSFLERAARSHSTSQTPWAALMSADEQ